MKISPKSLKARCLVTSLLPLSPPPQHNAAMATSLPWHPFLSLKPHHRHSIPTRHSSTTLTVTAFRRSDFDGFRKRVASGEVWRDTWRSANDGFEQLMYETRKTAERIDRQYEVSRRLSEVAETAAVKAREIDRDFEITQRWRSFSLDFSRDLPRYRKQLSGFLKTPLGKTFSTVFFLWFALSGWLFRVLIFATWVLPFAGPLLIGTVANNFVIKGDCPACKRQFVGYKTQIIRCTSCGNIVWQPQGKDFFSRGDGKGRSSPSKSDPDIIDVDFEEK